MRSRTLSLAGLGLVAVLWHGLGVAALEFPQEPLPAPSGAQTRPAREALLHPDPAVFATPAPDRFRVRFETTQGPVVLQVQRRWAPHGADRLYHLVRLGYYDDQRVFRVRAGFIAQFGVSGDPAINAVWQARTLPDDPPRRSNTRGTVAYAMLQAPASRTTQVYVNLADNSRLDAQGFAPIGRIIEGMDAVDALYAGYDEAAGGGMRGGRQGPILRGGNAYLDEKFPRLDRIVSARIEPASVLSYPSPGGNRIRVEQHLLPAVSTGPLDPSWSPDGRWIAFSMRGDIWKVPAQGGQAVALTHGPAYHFEPAWSPDGRSIALSFDLDGNLEIGVVPAGGGEVRAVTHHPHLDIEPAWLSDGRTIVFASARGNDFDLYRVDVDTGTVAPLLMGPGHQIQPAVSPDGATLAFVSPVPGHLGTGRLWTLPLAASGASGPPAGLEQATLVHVEETSYRAQPTFSADARALLYVTDTAGSNDLAAVPLGGGSPLRLTQDERDEYSPAPSPDARKVAFVSNRSGATRLYVAPAGGARRQAWREVTITGLRPAVPTGTVHIGVLDADSGEPIAARVSVLASDERYYAPAGGFHKLVPATDVHYFHTDRAVEVRVPAGTVTVQAQHGFEFAPAAKVVTVRAGQATELTLRLRRVFDGPGGRWYSGETHAHDLHQGRFGLSHRAFFTQLVADDLHATNALIHMDGTRIMGRWRDLTGEPHPLSTPQHVLWYAQEFRGSFGHVGLLGISEFVMPLIAGTPNTVLADDVLNASYLEAAREQGGFGGFMHPYSRRVREPEDGATSEIALDAGLGLGTFYDIANIWYDELENAEMYYRLLNAGIRLAATGGSDNFADVWRDPAAGTDRTYAHLQGALSVPAWLEALRAGTTFATNGPLLLLQVNGREPGSQIDLKAGAGPVRVQVSGISIAPLDRIEVVANGSVVATFDARAQTARFQFETTVPLPAGGWIAARALGPPSRFVADSYAFAHTSPVWIVRSGKPWISAPDARFLADMVRALWHRVQQRDRFASPQARARYEDAVNRAIARYSALARRAATE